jgi:hypothetical protein
MVENKSSQGRSRLFKRVIACLFPVAMLFALVGCNHPASVDSSKPSDSDVASDSTSETASDSSSSSSSNQTDSAVPEYQGMTVKRSAESTANGRKYNADNPSSSDSSGTEGDGTPDKDISDVVDVTVTNDQTVRYYVNKNETFIVDVHLSNPKQYEIQSFTLNGKKYSNYMFKDGSDLENLLLEVVAPSTSGYVGYTIDAIKYIEGTEIKDVKMTGDKTIQVGVKYDVAPTATVSAVKVGTTSLSMDITVVDNDKLIQASSLAAFLSDGQKVVAQKDLKVGDNSIEFTDLFMSTAYQYGVAAIYDLVDGKENQFCWLTKADVNTLKAYSLSNVVATKTSVSFEIATNGTVGTIKDISLIDKGTQQQVQTLTDLSLREFTGLLSDHDYQIRVTFAYDVGDKKDVMDSDTVGVKTLALTAPQIGFKDLATTQTAIDFGLDVVDPDGIAKFSKVELLNNGVTEKTITDSSLLEFSKLLSNREYSIKATYSYNLNDGKGDQLVSASTTQKTLAKTAPQVSINDLASTKTSISFGIDVTDPDNLYTADKATASRGETVDQTLTDFSKKEFDGLLSNNDYTITLTYHYDLNDGDGVHTKTVTASQKTEAKVIPQVSFKDIASTKTSVSFGLETVDPDALCSIVNVQLYLGDGLVATLTDLTTKQFEALLSDRTYTLKVTYSYDLNDGKGVQQKTVNATASTYAKELPSLTLSDVDSTKKSISFNWLLTDPDNLAIVDKAELIHGTDTPKVLTDFHVRTFTDLLSNNSYTLRLTYHYDLNDGMGVITKTVEQSVKTQAITVPTVALTYVTSTKTAISFGLTTTDQDGVLSIDKADLYKGNSLQTTLTDLTTKEFTDLLSDNTYTLQVAYHYDLNDGMGQQDKTVSQDIATSAKVIPAVTLQSLSSTKKSVSLDYAITDSDKIAVLDKAELYLGDQLQQSLTDFSTKEFTGLLSNNAYTVKLTYHYDLNDGTGIQTKTLEASIATLAMAAPTVTLKNIASTKTSISFDLDTTDVDSVLVLNKAELFKGESIQKTLTDLTTKEFTDLLSNNAYTMTITYSYDLNDGKGVQTATVSGEATTGSKVAPSISLKSIVLDSSSLSGAVSLDSDPDNLYQADSIVLSTTGASDQTAGDTSSFAFTGLSSYTDYTLTVNYHYDLNDGAGKQTASKVFTYKTYPYLNVTSTSVLNTTAVSEGDTIVVEADVDNPSKATFSKVVINGTEYDVSSASKTNYLRVEIKNDGQFEGGTTNLEIQKIYCTLDSKTYSAVPSTDKNHASVFINGKLEVVSLDAAYFNGTTYEKRDYFFPSEADKMYYYVTLNNKTGYQVDKVTIDGTEYSGTSIVVIDSSHIAIKKTFSSTIWNQFSLTALSYSNSTVAKDLTYTSISGRVYRVASDTVHEIKTKDDLLSMKDAYYYRLINDIDLQGVNWEGADNFDGVFDGNHHTISNMKCVSTFTNTDIKLGLFKQGSGVINDLTIDNVVYMVDNKATDGKTYNAYFGGLVAHTNFQILVINGCALTDTSGRSSVSITTTGETTSLGGLAGWVNSGYFNNCYSEVNISGSGNYVGGLVGYGSSVTFASCYSSGNVSGSSTIGGLVGYTDSVTLLSCYSSGNVSGSGNIGGLVGRSGSATLSLCHFSGSVTGSGSVGGLVGDASTATLTSCYSTGNVTSSNQVGGLVGYANTATAIKNCFFASSTNLKAVGDLGSSATLTITNSYACMPGDVTETGLVTATKEQLNTKSFYTDVLGWSEDVWDFSHLDVDNGLYPTLKA